MSPSSICSIPSVHSVYARRRSSLVLALVVGLVLAVGGRASAQDGGTTAEPPAAPVVPPTTAPPAADQPAQPPGPPRGGGIVTYHSPMRPACEDELARDHDWFDNLKGRLADKLNRDIHTTAAHYATANNKHVVAAYAVFWVFTVGFVLMMWRRQRALQAELARLERDLAKALKEGGAS